MQILRRRKNTVFYSRVMAITQSDDYITRLGLVLQISSSWIIALFK
jgi:hypothetical protein